jgi:hypothetical protein
MFTLFFANNILFVNCLLQSFRYYKYKVNRRLACKTLWPVLKKRTVYVIHVEFNISRSNNLANSDMQVNTVHDGLSIAKFALCWLAACHYLQNTITEPKNKII